MNPDKKYIVDELLERLNNSPFLVVVDYVGVTVPEFAELRGALAETGAECHVAKNTFVNIALKQAELPEIDGLKGQTAFVTGETDVCGAAKVIKEFSKKNKKAEIKSGILDGKALSKEEVLALAELPSREVLLATLLGVINAPAQKLVATLNEPAGSLARVINAKHGDAE